MRSILCSVCLLLLLGGAAFAQTDRGTITGTISDASSAMIGGATIIAKNSQTGVEHQAASTATGNYTLAQLPAGTYELSVTATGFKKYVRPGIIVSVAQVVRVNATLEVGQISEMVTVEAAAPLLKTESGELSHNVNYERVDNLPLLTLDGAGGGGIGNIRNPLQVVSLLPGATFAGDNTLRINGMPSSSASIRVEGQDATNGMWRQLTQANQAGVDAIQEVSVQTSNFAAEYGQAGGGYFNYTMKSGTNKLHGSAYDYLNNEALNSGIPFTATSTSGNIRNTLRRNDFGFTLGGPVFIPRVIDGRDKAFFFFNFEQFREDRTIRDGIATMPTLAYKSGDFRGATSLFGPGIGLPMPPDPLGRVFLANTVMDPATDTKAPNGAIVRNPIQCNGVVGVICSNRFDPVAVKLQSLFPDPNLPGLINNYAIPAYTNFRHTTIPSIKMDVNLSSKIKLSGYFSETMTNSPQSTGFSLNLIPHAVQADRAYTSRLNYDHTLTPTLLWHVGIGLMYFDHPTTSPTYDQSQLWASNQQFAAPYMPTLGGMDNFFTGGISMGSGFFAPTPGQAPWDLAVLKDIKPTANSSVTWVKSNHTIKAGAELILEGFPQQSSQRANGQFTFSGIETSNPAEAVPFLGFFNTGFPYASFLLGVADGLVDAMPNDTRLGNHSFAFYAQDTWKVTHRLTLDYGLRYDFVTLLREQYGRMQNAGFNTFNPLLGRNGLMLYEATCNCSFNNNYPYAFGPRIGLAYQINEKTVLRVGSGISYGTAPNNAFLSYSVADFYQIPAPGYGEPAGLLRDGNPYAPGNRFGNTPLKWPDYTNHFPDINGNNRPPSAPFISIDRNAGRPPRILQWSIGLQRELARNLVVEATYVGNRGVWWTAPVLAAQNYNALTPQGLLSERLYGNTTGLDITKAADQALLLTPISSPDVLARFPQLKDPNVVYPGFPASQKLNQALRPYPQWLGIPPFLGPPLGTTWYDSLQAKITKRYSHGLDMQASFTWQKEETLGVNSDTSYFTPGTVEINDVFNRASLKQLSALSKPFMLVVSFNYKTPAMNSSTLGLRVLSMALRDWTLGGVLRYQSGNILGTPESNNNLFAQLARTDNPATFGGANTLYNRNPGVPLFLVDPNSHPDPMQKLSLNPAAWTDAAPGQFGTGAAYYNDFRWQRQPSESLSLGRIFRLGAEDKGRTLQIRAEFMNVFNRVQLPQPSSGGPFSTTPATPQANGNPGGTLSGGWGFVDTIGSRTSMTPRTGQLVMRLNF